MDSWSLRHRGLFCVKQLSHTTNLHTRTLQGLHYWINNSYHLYEKTTPRKNDRCLFIIDEKIECKQIA